MIKSISIEVPYIGVNPGPAFFGSAPLAHSLGQVSPPVTECNNPGPALRVCCDCKVGSSVLAHRKCSISIQYHYEASLGMDLQSI